MREVVIPDSVEIIDEGVFSYCPNLISVTLPWNCEMTGRVWWSFNGSNIKYINGYVLPDKIYYNDSFYNNYQFLKNNRKEFEIKESFIDSAIDKIERDGFALVNCGMARIMYRSKEAFIKAVDLGGNKKANEIIRNTYLDRFKREKELAEYENHPEDYKNYLEEMGK